MGIEHGQAGESYAGLPLWRAGGDAGPQELSVHRCAGGGGQRCKVEHPFQIGKRQFGYATVVYRGLTKNMNRFMVLFASANLLMCARAGRSLAAVAGEEGNAVSLGMARQRSRSQSLIFSVSLD